MSAPVLKQQLGSLTGCSSTVLAQNLSRLAILLIAYCARQIRAEGLFFQEVSAKPLQGVAEATSRAPGLLGSHVERDSSLQKLYSCTAEDAQGIQLSGANVFDLGVIHTERTHGVAPDAESGRCIKPDKGFSNNQGMSGEAQVSLCVLNNDEVFSGIEEYFAKGS